MYNVTKSQYDYIQVAREQLGSPETFTRKDMMDLVIQGHTTVTPFWLVNDKQFHAGKVGALKKYILPKMEELNIIERKRGRKKKVVETVSTI